MMIERRLQQVKLPFPWKLVQMLEDAEKESFNDIISWLPNGKAFHVYKPKEFSEEIMSSYFKQTKFKSFTRQLYIYGFIKLATGPDVGAFYHPDFIRNDRMSCLSLKRNQGTDRRLKGGKGGKNHKKVSSSSSLSSANKMTSKKSMIMKSSYMEKQSPVVADEIVSSHSQQSSSQESNENKTATATTTTSNDVDDHDMMIVPNGAYSSSDSSYFSLSSTTTRCWDKKFAVVRSSDMDDFDIVKFNHPSLIQNAEEEEESHDMMLTSSSPIPSVISTSSSPFLGTSSCADVSQQQQQQQGRERKEYVSSCTDHHGQADNEMDSLLEQKRRSLEMLMHQTLSYMTDTNDLNKNNNEQKEDPVVSSDDDDEDDSGCDAADDILSSDSFDFDPLPFDADTNVVADSAKTTKYQDQQHDGQPQDDDSNTTSNDDLHLLDPIFFLMQRPDKEQRLFL